MKPKRTSKPEEMISLSGLLLPYHKGAPVLLMMPDSEFQYVPLFRTLDGMEAVMTRSEVPFDRFCKVDDGALFLEGFSDLPTLRVIVDPWYTPEGRVRFTQVRMPGDEEGYEQP